MEQKTRFKSWKQQIAAVETDKRAVEGQVLVTSIEAVHVGKVRR